MKGKIFTLAEVNLMLALVSRIAGDIVAKYSEAEEKLKELEQVKAKADKGEVSVRQLRLCDDLAGKLLDELQDLVEEIEALGGVAADYHEGLIDFYGELDGEIVYFCWKLGEKAIGHWHKLEEGCTERQPASANATL